MIIFVKFVARNHKNSMSPSTIYTAVYIIYIIQDVWSAFNGNQLDSEWS